MIDVGAAREKLEGYSASDIVPIRVSWLLQALGEIEEARAQDLAMTQQMVHAPANRTMPL